MVTMLEKWGKSPKEACEVLKARTQVFMAKNMPVVTGALMLTFCLMFANGVDAAPDVSGLIKKVLEGIATIVIALGVIFAVLGVVHYASANTEGDGPAKHKAQAQIAGGIMILLVSIWLSGNAQDIADMISSNS